MDDLTSWLDPDELAAAVAAGVPLARFAEEMGVPLFAVIRFARRHGTDLPRREDREPASGPATAASESPAATTPVRQVDDAQPPPEDVENPSLPPFASRSRQQRTPPSKPRCARPRKRNRWNDPDRLAAAVADGLSDADIAARAGVVASTVASWRRSHRILRTRPAPPRPGPVLTDPAELRDALQRGGSDTAAAELLGVSAATVATSRRRLGVDAAPRSLSDGRLADRDWLAGQYGPPGFRTSPDIAGELGVAANTVVWWLRKHGIEIRPRKTRYAQLFYYDWVSAQVRDDDTRARAARRIAEEIGCTPSAAERALRQHGLAEPSASTAPHPALEDADEMRRMWVDASMSDETIAEHLGVGATTVARYRRAHGLSPADRDDPRTSRPWESSYRQLNDAGWLADMYSSASARDIADRVGCSEPAVLAALRQHGIDVRPAGVRVDRDDVEAA